MEPAKELNLKAIFNDIMDIDRLVELVKVRPVIWDNTVEGYRNRDVSVAAWQQIYRIMFMNYDELHSEQKIFIGKVIKDKWTNARDSWQRTHKKRKEALQKRENVNDLKDNPRYEKLKFLAKIYDKDDNLEPAKEDKVWDASLVNIASPHFPKVDIGGENVPNFSNTSFCGKPSNFINRITPQKQGCNLSSKKRKTENSNELIPLVKKYKETNPRKPAVVNIEDKLKTGFSSSPGKHRTSTVDSRESRIGRSNIIKFLKSEHIRKKTINQLQSLKCEQISPKTTNQVQSLKCEKMSPKTTNQVQSLKCEQISPKTIKEEIPENTQSLNKSCIQVPQKAVRPPSQPLHQDDHRRSSISNDKNTKPELIEKADIKEEINETTIEQTSSKRHSQDNKPTNSEVDQFFQVLKPRIEDFNQTQMIGFLFEMLKPRIKDFDKRQLLDFQIETLQLIKKMEGN